MCVMHLFQARCARGRQGRNTTPTRLSVCLPAVNAGVPEARVKFPRTGTRFAIFPMMAANKPSSQPAPRTVFPQIPRVSTMEAESQRPKGREGAISALDAAVKAMNLAEKTSDIVPAKAVFSSVRTLLTMIRVRFLLSATVSTALTPN